jgi:hypothetical protein
VPVNVADEDPEATTTLDGSDRAVLVLDKATVTEFGRAAAVSVTVHVTLPGVANVTGAQERPLIVVGNCCTAMLFPVAVVLMPVPVEDAAIAPVKPTGTAVLVTFCASVTFTVATAPFAITFLFNPDTIHWTMPLPGLHVIAFPAADVALPADNVIAAISVGLYDKAH